MCTDQRASNVQPKEKLALASILAGGHVNFQVPHNRLSHKNSQTNHKHAEELSGGEGNGIAGKPP